MIKKQERKDKMGEQNKTIENIYKNYRDMEKALVNELNFNVEHPGTIGGYREEVWKSLFEKIIPKKFSVERSVFVIDSKGNVSNEIDLVVFDEQYTPYIFRYGTLKFIPIEAVAVVIECKSKTVKIDNWNESIDKLRTEFSSIARMAGNIVVHNEDEINSKLKQELKYDITQSSTRPIKILCCANNNSKNFEKESKIFDFIIQAKKEEEKFIIICKENGKKLLEWHNNLNHYEGKLKNKWPEKGNKQNVELKNFEVKESSILTLIFQLNQLLMLINNPLLFPHMAYVNLFNNYTKSY